MPNDPPLGLGIVQLLSAPVSEVKDHVTRLLHKAKDKTPDSRQTAKAVELVEELLIRRFPELSREEVRKMFQLHDLRKTRTFGRELGTKARRKALNAALNKELAKELNKAKRWRKLNWSANGWPRACRSKTLRPCWKFQCRKCGAWPRLAPNKAPECGPAPESPRSAERGYQECYGIPHGSLVGSCLADRRAVTLPHPCTPP